MSGIKQEDLPTMRMMWDGYAEKLLSRGIGPDKYQYQAMRRAFYNGVSCIIQACEFMTTHRVPMTVQTLQIQNIENEIKDFFTAEANNGRI